MNRRDDNPSELARGLMVLLLIIFVIAMVLATPCGGMKKDPREQWGVNFRAD